MKCAEINNGNGKRCKHDAKYGDLCKVHKYGSKLKRKKIEEYYKSLNHFIGRDGCLDCDHESDRHILCKPPKIFVGSKNSYFGTVDKLVDTEIVIVDSFITTRPVIETVEAFVDLKNNVIEEIEMKNDFVIFTDKDGTKRRGLKRGCLVCEMEMRFKIGEEV